MTELTQLLRKVQQGEAGARDALFAAAYSGLQQLARARLRQGGRSTLLDTRSLVHESYLRCVQSGSLRAEDRRAFFAYASQVMRSVIVTAARERAAEKRGGGQRAVTLSEQISDEVPDSEQDILRVHEALRIPASRSTRGWRRWCRCATSAATVNRKSPTRWMSPSARCSGCGSRRG